MTTNAHDLPSTPRAEYLAAAPDIQLIRDQLAGTRRMHAQYKVYIPKWAAEKPEGYKKRATSAKLYGGLARSLSASVGMLFAKPPKLVNTTPAIDAHAENIDGKGTHHDVFLKRKAEDGLADGIAYILVDFARVPEGVVVHGGNEVALNLRPLWCGYSRADVLNWVTAIIDNVETTVQVTLREAATTRTGKYGVVTNLRYRRLQLSLVPPPPERPTDPPTRVATWELVEEVKAAEGTTERRIDGGFFRDRLGRVLGEIPLAVGYAGRTDALFCADPPLLPIAWCNLEHYRISCDLRYYESLCAYPQPYIKGSLAPTGLITADGAAVPAKFQMGPNVLWHLTADSEAGFVELAGTTLDKLAASVQRCKDEMGELGASFLAKKTRGVETAEAKRIDSAAENATLATAAVGIADMANQAWRFHAMYLGIEPAQAPTVALNTEFEDLSMDPALMDAYTRAVTTAGFPLREWLEQLQQGGRIRPDADLDELANEIMAGQAAIEAEQQRQADALAASGQVAA